MKINLICRFLKLNKLLNYTFLYEKFLEFLDKKEIDVYYLYGLSFLNVILEYFIAKDDLTSKLQFIDQFKMNFDIIKYSTFHFYNILPCHLLLIHSEDKNPRISFEQKSVVHSLYISFRIC